ncbi:NAD(P)/FAD-dependent oxidoreductase [Lentilactobacillus hilgardii]|nr:NAD(P)/FAD-dependent oxidoreductase [Lentilactobacillus hilgardii]MCV3739783.1 NAD(P)/FAD-dependent oxidoreductase [Lentilactobacillus hilgardii]
MKTHYDVIIFGAGPAGTAAAYGLVGSKSVLVIENDLFGGTCPNRGCDPKKMLYSAVEAKDRVARMQESGLKDVPAIDWKQLMAFKRGYTSQIPSGTKRGLSGAGIDTYHGQAAFLDQHRIQLGDQTTVSADEVILATGRRPRLLDIPGKSFLKTSTDFLDLDALPKHITFVGAGLVSMELANIANKAGSDVDIIHHNDQPLKAFPQPLVAQLVQDMIDDGITFHFNQNLKAVSKNETGYTLTTDLETLASDYVVEAVGRSANSDQLQLENCGVKTSSRGVLVDDHLRTNVSTIYAIGDVVDKAKPKLTPVASFEGRYVAELLTKKTTAPIQYPVIPQILFGTTEVGQVGVGYQEALSKPEKYHVSAFDLTHWYTYNRIKDDVAKAMVIRDANTKQIVGFDVLSSIGEHLLNAFSLVMNLKLSNEQIQDMIFAYPSVSSDLQYLV